MKPFKVIAIILFLTGLVFLIFHKQIKNLFQKETAPKPAPEPIHNDTPRIPQPPQPAFHGKGLNNPFNIKTSNANNWKGKTTALGDRFESFDTLTHGIRAGIKTLQTYFDKHNIKTIDGIINRFAPPVENDTPNYINFVVSELKVPANVDLVPSKETLFQLSKAIVKMENGFNLSQKQFDEAYNLI